MSQGPLWEPFTTLTAVAAPLPLDKVEADQIIPAKLCVRPAGASYADALFAPWRYSADGVEDVDFILNRPGYRTARILVTGALFGYGSSREHAAWAVRDYGIRVVIAHSFAAIFRANAARNGVLPVELPAGALAILTREVCSGPTELTVDLQAETVTSPTGSRFSFDVATLEKRLLLAGTDTLGLAMGHLADVDAFQVADRRRRPWVYKTLATQSAM